MSETSLKNKIHKTLEKMDADQLRSALNILQAFSNQQKYSEIQVDKLALDKQIAIGIKQLDNGEGTDFSTFLNEMQADYGSK